MSKHAKWFLLGIAALGCAAFAVYDPAIGAPFIFDDRDSVVDNCSIVRLWPLFGDAAHPGPLNPPIDSSTAGRPLVNLSLALNYQFSHLDPSGYQIANLILHVFTAALLMAIVARTLRLEYFGARFQRASGILAFLVALLWAVHPLQTETVIYVTQRTELMVGFFYMATLYASLRYWAADSAGARNTWLAVATATCIAGMACKEVMVTAPVVVLIFERTFLTGSFRQAWQKSKPLYIGLLISWALLFYLNFSAPRSDSAGFHLGVPGYVWWFTQAKVLLLYLKLIVWPWPLAIHYEIPYLTSLSQALLWVLPVAALAIGTLTLLRRQSAVGFVGAWVFLILSPTLVVPIVTEVAAERRMYLPLAAIIALVVVGGYWFLQQAVHWAVRSASIETTDRHSAAATIVIAVLLAIGLSLLSARRLSAFHDEIALWQSNVAYQPNDYLAHSNLGLALVEAGRIQAAVEHCQQACELKPDYVNAHYNLGNALAKAGRLQDAVEQYQFALKLNPDSPEAHNNLGSALFTQQKYDEAIAQYQAAIRTKPTFSSAYYNLGTVYFKVDRPQDGIEQYKLALQYKPDYTEAHLNLGVALAHRGQVEEAVEHFRKTLELKPDSLDAYSNLTMAYAQLHRSDEAMATAQQALKVAQAKGQIGVVRQIETWLSQNRSPQANQQQTSPPAGTVHSSP